MRELKVGGKKKTSGRSSTPGRPLILFPIWHIILFPFSLNVIWELSIINGPLIGQFFDWHFLIFFFFPRSVSVVPSQIAKINENTEPHAVVGQNFLNLSWSQENLFDCLGSIEADLLFSNRYQSCLNKWFVLAGERHWIETMCLWALWFQVEPQAARRAVSLQSWFQPNAWGRERLSLSTTSWAVLMRTLGALAALVSLQLCEN